MDAETVISLSSRDSGKCSGRPIDRLVHCFSSRYADNNLSLVDIKQRCNGTRSCLVAVRERANWTLWLGAYVTRFFATPAMARTSSTAITVSIGTIARTGAWAGASGSGVSRNRCDTRGEPERNNRLCWHTENGRVMGGYRCGARTGLTASTDWERAFFTNRNSAGLGDIYDSCKDALADDQRQSGVYNVMPPGAPEPRRVYCDQQTDGGGWTLVGSSRGVPLGDVSSGYYEDIASLSPALHTRVFGLVYVGLIPDLTYASAAAESSVAPMTQ